jgi:hypothetical protein
VGLFDEKTEGRKSRDTVPLNKRAIAYFSFFLQNTELIPTYLRMFFVH